MTTIYRITAGKTHALLVVETQRRGTQSHHLLAQDADGLVAWGKAPKSIIAAVQRFENRETIRAAA